MNAVVINASSASDVNSLYIAEKLAGKYEDCKVFNLSELDFDPSYAFQKSDSGFRPELVEEGLRDVMTAVNECGLIIFISPNYFGFLSGLAKMFLDRFYVFQNFSGRPTFEDEKKFFFVLTQSSTNRGSGQQAQDWMKKFAGIFDMKFFGITVPGCKGREPEGARMKIDEISMSLNMFV